VKLDRLAVLSERVVLDVCGELAVALHHGDGGLNLLGHHLPEVPEVGPGCREEGGPGA
jgi:hypothetical protein